MKTLIRSPAAAFVALFLLSAVLRVNIILKSGLPRLPHVLAKFGFEMERAGLSVAETGTIGDVFADGSGPTAHVSPAYACILGAVYRLSGPSRERMRLGAGIFSALVVSVAIGLLPTLARRTGLRPWVGPASALLMALHPYFFAVEIYGDWEQPLAALTLLLAILDVDARRRDGRRSASGAIRSGLLLGWSALLSPPVALAAGLMHLGQLAADPGDWRRIARSLAIAGAVAAVVLLPWAVRNYRTLGAFVPLRSNLGLELYVSNNDEATGAFDEDPEDQKHPYASEGELAEYRRLGEVPYMREKMRVALGWIGSHPARFAWLTGRRAVLFWFRSDDLRAILASRNPALALVRSHYYYSALTLLAFAGLAGLCLRRHPARWIYAAALIGPSLIYLAVQVMNRYRYPAYPVMILLSWDFALGILGRLRGRRDGPAGGAETPAVESTVV